MSGGRFLSYLPLTDTHPVLSTASEKFSVSVRSCVRDTEAVFSTQFVSVVRIQTELSLSY